MPEHTKRSQRKDYKNYLGDKIQNEVINLMGENIKSKILELTKKAKYFSILLDCTPDSLSLIHIFLEQCDSSLL